MDQSTVSKQPVLCWHIFRNLSQRHQGLSWRSHRWFLKLDQMEYLPYMTLGHYNAHQHHLQASILVILNSHSIVRFKFFVIYIFYIFTKPDLSKDRFKYVWFQLNLSSRQERFGSKSYAGVPTRLSLRVCRRLIKQDMDPCCQHTPLQTVFEQFQQLQKSVYWANIGREVTCPKHQSRENCPNSLW